MTIGQLLQFVLGVLQQSEDIKRDLEANTTPEYQRFTEYLRVFAGLNAELRYPVSEAVAENLKEAFVHAMAASFTMGFIAALLDQQAELRTNPTLLQSLIATVAVNVKESLDVQVVPAGAGTDVPAGGTGPMPVVS